MFTGLVEEVGRIQNIRRGSRSCVLTVACSEVLQGSRIGDSIAVNGVCLTATAIGSGYFTADAMPETLDRSSLGQLGPGSPVNLERAMPADGRFGGHIVSGHIDGTGVVRSLEQDDNAVWYTIAASPDVLRYIVEKGSVAIDGISLTVAYVDEEVFKVSIIPHTREVTALSAREAGSVVNLECDIVGKYIEKLIRPYRGGTAEKKSESRISEAFLMENGFL
jgi:riboflavin synthase